MRESGIGETAQLVRGLPSKYKDRSLIPQNPLKNGGCSSSNLLSKFWKCIDRKISGAYWTTSLS